MSAATCNRNKLGFSAALLIAISPVVIWAINNTRLRFQIVLVFTSDDQILVVSSFALQLSNPFEGAEPLVITEVRIQCVKRQIQVQRN